MRHSPGYTTLVAGCILAAAGAVRTQASHLPQRAAAWRTAPDPEKDDSRIDPILFFATGRGPAHAVPGIAGTLRLDLPTLSVLPSFHGFGPALDPLLRSLPAGGFSYQTLRGRPGLLGFSSPASVSLALGFGQQDDLAACRGRAQRHLDSVRGTGMAPTWKTAAIAGAPRAMYRPDVKGVAYYEFPVLPEGFIVVATGGHDLPIPHWNHGGNTIAHDLEQRAAKANTRIARIYKLDTLCYVAEDAAGEQIANIGSIPPKLVPDPRTRGGYRFAAWSSFAELKAGFATAYRPLIENLRLDAADDWRLERAASSIGPQGDWSPWYYYWAGYERDQRYYSQWRCCGCLSGCGATAWAMLFGWADYRASLNDSRWRNRWGIYRENGGTGSDAVAPRSMDSGVMSMIRQIRSEIATFCITDSGATFPWDMSQASRYLAPRTGAHLDTHYNSFGIHEGGLRDYVRDQIKYSRTPGILGTGWLNHYPLAWGYAYRYKDDWFWGRQYSRWFYVNQGWGGSGDGWIGDGTWFAGRLFP